jgi:tRNA-splicing ligase RtcB (3'-phosphate/5'-hydroxy nucleic acid ligase)
MVDEQRPYPVWGTEIDEQAHKQMASAMSLPVAVAGALMPDAHVGYGLPIGGVLATENAVVPYAVGVDIACRMMMTVYDLPAERIDKDRPRLENILIRNTLFGAGQAFREKNRAEHAVMDEDWDVSPVTCRVKDKAWGQLGTSGSGNHFVEFGEVEVLAAPVAASNDSGLFRDLQAGEGDSALSTQHPAQRRIAVLSHSGSRGPGPMIAQFYSKLAREKHPELPKELSYLAWLDLDTEEGQEYWAAMELMGKFASANHHIIHAKIERDMKQMGARPVFQVENHHNYAWKEEHVVHGRRRELIVHRKGATPAGRGVLGLIPGSMAAPGYLVEGLGEARSLDSAAHGAGRRMSRTQAKQSTRWSHVKEYLKERNVVLLSAGLDEAPSAYKDIEEVMAAQRELVRPLARFVPRIVRMAPEGERPED